MPADHVRIEVWQHGDLVRSPDGGQDGADRRVGEGGHEVVRPVLRRAVLTRRGYSTGSTPTTSRRRRIACSWISGKWAGAAHEGERTATRPPRAIFGGATSVTLMTPLHHLSRLVTYSGRIVAERAGDAVIGHGLFQRCYAEPTILSQEAS